MSINKKLSPVVGVLIMVLIAGVVVAAVVSNTIFVNGEKGITVSNPSVKSGNGLTLAQVEYKGYYPAMPAKDDLMSGQTYGFSFELMDKNAVYKGVKVSLEITKSGTTDQSLSKNIAQGELEINYWDNMKNAWVPVELKVDGHSASGTVDYWSATHITPGYDVVLPLDITAYDLGTYSISAEVVDTISD